MSSASRSATGREPALVYHAVSNVERRLLTGFMHRAFVVVYDESPELGALPASPAEIHKIAPADLSAIKLFAFRGHGLPQQVTLRAAYPEILADDRYLLFTFLADPLRSRASGYSWYISEQNDRPKASFAETLRARKPNVYADALGCSWWNYRRVLRRYFFLGISEQSEASVSALAAKIDAAFAAGPQSTNVARARYFMRHVMRSPDEDSEDRADQIAKLIADLDPKDVEAFRRRNRLDYSIYAHACARLAQDAGRLPALPAIEPVAA